MQVAEALEGQKQTNRVSKQLHARRAAELAKVAEQVGCALARPAPGPPAHALGAMGRTRAGASHPCAEHWARL
jgi:hypothetical protein